MTNKKYVFTCNENYSEFALLELKKITAAKFVKWLDLGIGLVETNSNFDFYNAILSTPIIFIRHIFLVDCILTHSNELRDNFYKKLFEKIDKTQSFSVQLRKTKDCNFNGNMFYETAKDLNQAGYFLDIKNPIQAVSVLATKEEIFVGIDKAYKNLSRFKGGECHYSTNNFISRAEFKLIEALEILNPDYSKLTTALDLGSAPGGWSKVLAEHNMTVYSIDPAELNQVVLKNKNIKHYKISAQEFANINKVKFNIVVNDMKMDMHESANIINKLYAHMCNGCFVILTLKLAHNFKLNDIYSILKLLNKNFKIITARQLFHNRSEVTVFLKK